MNIYKKIFFFLFTIFILFYLFLSCTIKREIYNLDAFNTNYFFTNDRRITNITITDSNIIIYLTNAFTNPDITVNKTNENTTVTISNIYTNINGRKVIIQFTYIIRSDYIVSNKNINDSITIFYAPYNANITTNRTLNISEYYRLEITNYCSNYIYNNNTQTNYYTNKYITNFIFILLDTNYIVITGIQTNFLVYAYNDGAKPRDLIPLDDPYQNKTMMQYFHWYLKNDGKHWHRAKTNAAYLKEIGITAVWLPPAYKAEAFNAALVENNYDHVGYSVYDVYDLGEFDQKGAVRTKYGTKQEYFEAIDELHKNSIEVIADIVMNHVMGGDLTNSELSAIKCDPDNRNNQIGSGTIKPYVNFPFTVRNGKYSTAKFDASWFDGVDASDGGTMTGKAIYRFNSKNWDTEVSIEKGNYDFLMGCDFDFQEPKVTNFFTEWAVWYVTNANLDGFRLDAVKHIRYEFIRDWIDWVRQRSGKPGLFAVAEFWAPHNYGAIDYYQNKVNRINNGTTYSNKIKLFDAPLNRNFSDLAENGITYNLRMVVTNHGTLMHYQPMHAVTLVENHDTQPAQALDSTTVTKNNNWAKQIAYAIILLKEKSEYPCVFYADLYGADINGDGDYDDLVQNYYNDVNKKNEFPPTPKLEKLIKARKYFAYGSEREIGNGITVGSVSETPDNDNVVAWVRGGDKYHPNSGCVVIIADAGSGGGTKTIFVTENASGVPNPRFVNKTFYDYLGNTTTKVTTDANGKGNFPIPPGGQAYVFVLEN